MKIGCCVGMFADETDPAGIGWLDAVADAGYDYAEFSVARIMKLSDEELDILRTKLDKLGLPCEACNGFFPGYIKLTGPEADWSKTEEYLSVATARAARLGAKYIVFGSPGARSYPEGFSKKEAFGQLADFLSLCAKYCEQHDLFIAIEPLNRGETNIILNLTEGAELMDAVNHPRIRLLSDYYHYVLEDETPEILAGMCSRLIHTHFAEVENRSYPTGLKDKYREFFETLIQNGFKGGCSIEARSQSVAEDIVRGFKALETYRNV